jgi:hypothetical protein
MSRIIIKLELMHLQHGMLYPQTPIQLSQQPTWKKSTSGYFEKLTPNGGIIFA